MWVDALTLSPLLFSPMASMRATLAAAARSTGEDARVERNGPEPEAGCQLPHADASSKEREKPKGRPMRERTQDQSSNDLDRHEKSACRKTAVLVLNWNNAAATLDCLACLQAGASELQAVAIDNGSSDGSADLIARVQS